MTTRPAARPTARISRPANMNTTEPPMMRPTRTLGRSMDRLNVPAAEPSACCTSVRNAPNSAVAASTAVAIAMPLVMALVVLPIASRCVRISAGSPSNSPDLSDGGNQAGPGQRHGEQGDGGVAGAEQERAVHGGADQQRRVHRGLEAD